MEYQLKYTDVTKAPVVVKSYTVNGPMDPTDLGAGLYPSATAANTSLVFMGKGMFDYGEPIQTNLLRLLENFSSPTAPDQPVEGQLWFNNGPIKSLNVWNGIKWDAISVNQAMTGDLDMNGYRIINLQNPADDHDAVNLKYVNDRYAKLIGDTFIGPVFMNEGIFVSKEIVVYNNSLIDMGFNRVRNVSMPAAADDAVPKKYVDDALSEWINDVENGALDNRYAKKAGDTFTGLVMFQSGLEIAQSLTISPNVVINAGENRIQYVADPIAPLDATNKQYVDNAVDGLKTDLDNGSLDTRYVKKTGDTMIGNYTLQKDGSGNGKLTVSNGEIQINAQGSLVAEVGANVYIDFGTY